MMVKVQRRVTNIDLSIALKKAGAPQVGASEWLVGPDDMPEEEKEKVVAHDAETMIGRIPMVVVIEGKRRAFDFCKYAVDDKRMFAASYRPEIAPLSDRKSVIAGGRQCESFTDALGYLELWLRTETNAFGKKIIAGPGADEKPVDVPSTETVEDASKPVFKKVETPPEEEPTDADTATP